MNVKLIILVPIIFIIILSTVLTNFLLSFEEKVLKTQLVNIEQRIISEQKQYTKSNINNIIEILNQKSHSYTKLQKEILKERTNNAIRLIDNIYKENKTLSKEKIFNKIRQYLNFISSANKSKYYYIYTLDGTCISVPVKRSLEGKNLIGLKDIKGQYVIQNMIKIAKSGGGFNQWYYINPNTNKTEMKIGYAKEYKPLNIFVGTAIYKNDIIKDIKKDSQKLILNYRTSHNGYIFAYNKKGTTIAHIKNSLIGINRWDLNKNGKYPIQDLLKKGQEEGGNYIFYQATINPKTGLPAKKISYVNEFKKLNWVLGTGFYVDEVAKDIKASQNKLQKEFNNDIKKIILTSIIITLILILILWIILNKISHKLKRTNSKLKNLNETLEEKITVEVKKSNHIQEQLFKSEKMASMGEMIGNIAHQWRQPLSIISTLSTGIIMKKEFGNLNEEELLKNCNTINDNVQYLSKTIDDFKNFIKEDRTKKVYSLNNTISKFFNLVEASSKNNNISVKFNLENTIQINGYENELIQALINIFNNAKDAFQDNTKKKKYIFISSRIKDNKAIIIIKDNAGGIPQDVLPKIFDPYFTTKHKSKGTGLGLNITYNLIVDGMNGSIEAKNKNYIYNEESYTGAEFIIKLSMQLDTPKKEKD